MLQTYLWDKPRGTIVYKDKNYTIVHKKGILTVGCQCFKDCTCSEDNKIKDVELYRVSGKNRHDRIPKPYNFNTFEEALLRVNELNK